MYMLRCSSGWLLGCELILPLGLWLGLAGERLPPMQQCSCVCYGIWYVHAPERLGCGLVCASESMLDTHQMPFEPRLSVTFQGGTTHPCCFSLIHPYLGLTSAGERKCRAALCTSCVWVQMSQATGSGEPARGWGRKSQRQRDCAAKSSPLQQGVGRAEKL